MNKGHALVVTRGDLTDGGGQWPGQRIRIWEGVGKLEDTVRSRLGRPWKVCQRVWVLSCWQ